MNPKRILVALVVVFIVLSGTSYLIHEVWLKGIYSQHAGTLWRKEPNLFGIHLGHFLMAIAFTMLWVRITLGGAGLPCAVALGFFLGVFSAGGAVITHAVTPLPEGLLTKWIIADMAQSILVGAILFFVYRPSKPAPDVGGAVTTRT